MPDFLTPTQISVEWRAADKQIRQIVRQAFIEWGKEAKMEARILSEGSLTYKDLRALGHPYATRHSPTWKANSKAAPNRRGTSKDPNQAAETAGGLAGQSAGIINKHSGEFQRGWRWQTSREYSNTVTGTLTNIAEKNEFMYGEALFTGTARMIARPTLADVALLAFSPQVDAEFGRVVDLIGDIFIGASTSGFKKA